jgi:hypothetical protein
MILCVPEDKARADREDEREGAQIVWKGIPVHSPSMSLPTRRPIALKGRYPVWSKNSSEGTPIG